MEDPDAPSAFPEGSPNRIKQLQMFAGTHTAYQLAKKHKIKTAFGTDMLFSASNAAIQGKQLTRLKKWYSNAEILRMATSRNAELLTLSGPRNPYPGKLGVIEEGAHADILLANGDPLADINLVADPDNNFTVIMKDGVIHKGL
jgi:imidazolonepropionase-like amidohydrolase